MGQFEDLRAFINIVELGSLRKAAQNMGLSKSAISRRLTQLEARLETSLIQRTPKQWMLTEAGHLFFKQGREILEYYDALESEVRDDRKGLSGPIRLTAPLYFGKFKLVEPLLTFAKMHPDLELFFDFNDRIVDIFAENFDLAIRIADMPDSNLKTRKLFEIQNVLCASPDYLRKNGAPQSPDDLRTHEIMQYGSSKHPTWTFVSDTGEDITVRVNSAFNIHDESVLLSAAERGFGIASVPDFQADDKVQDGRLEIVLPNHQVKPRSVYVLYHSSRYQPKRVRLLIDFLVKNLKDQKTAT